MERWRKFRKERGESGETVEPYSLIESNNTRLKTILAQSEGDLKKLEPKIKWLHQFIRGAADNSTFGREWFKKYVGKQSKRNIDLIIEKCVEYQTSKQLLEIQVGSHAFWESVCECNHPALLQDIIVGIVRKGFGNAANELLQRCTSNPSLSNFLSQLRTKAAGESDETLARWLAQHPGENS